MAKIFRVAVIGCGGISNVHFHVLSSMEDVKIVACCDIAIEKAKAAAKKYGCEAVVDWKNLLGRDDIDVVHLCTPHYLHAPMALAFLAEGKHVLTEKPMASELADMDAMIAADQGRLGVVFQNRYNTSSQAAKRYVENKEFGELLGIRGQVCWHRTVPYYVDSGWRGKWSTEGGGVLINQAIHTLDLVRWLGGEVVKLAGRVSTDYLTGVIEVEDTAHATLFFKSGIRGVFYATNAYVSDSPIEVELMFEHASLRIKGDSLTMEKDGMVRQLTLPLIAETGGKGYWGTGHAALIRDYYDHIIAGKPFWINGAEGAHALRLLKTIYASSQAGGPVEVRDQ